MTSLRSKLEGELKRRAKQESSSIPTMFDLRKAGDQRKLQTLISGKKALYVVDDYREQLHELFAVKNPSIVYAPIFGEELRKYIMGLEKKRPLWQQGSWVYYPWLATVVHVVPDEEFQMVRTARNKNLITGEEQKNFYNAVIGIGGLSVGNSVALALVLQGGGRYFRLADHDRLALSNTNRIRVGVASLGLRKVEMTARHIYEINPYVKVELFSEGLTPKNIGRFFSGPPKLDIVIDEMDNIAVKFLLREQARKHKIAVVMAADNGDNAVVDVERYDKNKKLQFFHGRIGKVTYKGLLGLDKFGIGKTITQHVGPENVTEKMQQSLLQMGKTIVSWPQLGGAALINGSAVAYCVRKILNDQPIESDRALISLDEKLIPGYDSIPQKKRRERAASAFRKIFGL
jgi:hypothetical protein